MSYTSTIIVSSVSSKCEISPKGMTVFKIDDMYPFFFFFLFSNTALSTAQNKIKFCGLPGFICGKYFRWQLEWLLFSLELSDYLNILIKNYSCSNSHNFVLGRYHFLFSFWLVSLLNIKPWQWSKKSLQKCIPSPPRFERIPIANLL